MELMRLRFGALLEEPKRNKMGLSDGDYGVAKPDMFKAAAAEATGFGPDGGFQPGKQGMGISESVESLFASNAATATQPPSILDSIVGALVDRDPNKAAAPVKPNNTLLGSLGVAGMLKKAIPSEILKKDRSGEHKVTDAGQKLGEVGSGLKTMETAYTGAKATFDSMKNAATAMMVNEAIKDGEKPGAYIKEDIDRDSFKAESIAGAFIGGKAGLVFAAMNNITTAVQEASTPAVDGLDEKRSKAAQRIKAEIINRASKSDAAKIEEKAKAGTFGGGKQDVSKDDPLGQGPKSNLDDKFFETQGYKDLEKCVMDGHDIEEIMDARFENQPEVKMLMDAHELAGGVKDHLMKLTTRPDEVKAWAQLDAAMERGTVKFEKSPTPREFKALADGPGITVPQPDTDLMASAAIFEQSMEGLRLPSIPAIKVAQDVKELLRPAIEPKQDFAVPKISVNTPIIR